MAQAKMAAFWNSSRVGSLGIFLGILGWVKSAPAGVEPSSSMTDENKLSKAEILRRESEDFVRKGRYGEAASSAERACSIIEKIRGGLSVESARCLTELAGVRRRQGKFKEAESLYEQVLFIREEALGANHPDVAEALNNLALAYHDQDYHERAEALARRALEVNERSLGAEHVEVITTLINLASMLKAQGKYSDAEPLLERALSTSERVLGPEHSMVALCLDSLVGMYQELGRYGESEVLMRRALHVMENELGKGHVGTTVIMHNMAVMYHEQGRLDEAELIYEQSLSIREKGLRSDHPWIAQSLNSLAVLYQHQGAFRKSEPLLVRALAIQEKELGAMSTSLAITINNLGWLYMKTGAYEKAMESFGRAFLINEEMLGANHLATAINLGNMAWVCHAQGAYEKAESLYERVLLIRRKVLGSEHPDVAKILNNMAVLSQDHGEYKRAESLLRRALSINMKVLGPSHPDVATNLLNLGLALEKVGSHVEAEQVSLQALSVLESGLGRGHPDVAVALNNIAHFYHVQGRYVESKTMYERAILIDETRAGQNGPEVTVRLMNLAILLRDQRNYDGAEELLKRVILINEKLDSRRPDVALALGHLALLFYDERRYEDALRLNWQALDIEEENIARLLTTASESRKLAYVSKLSGSMHSVLSLHLRVASSDDRVAELALTTLLRRKSRAQDLVAQSSVVIRRSLRESDEYLLDELSDIDSQIGTLVNRGAGTPAAETDVRRLDELKDQRNQLWGKLAKNSGLVEALGRPTTIEEIQLKLSAGSVLVELAQYVPQHDDTGIHRRKNDRQLPLRYAAYLIFADHFDWVDLGAADLIDDQIEAFRTAVQTKQAISADLYDVVMRPIIDKLGSTTHRLVIAPAGALNLIPFGALYDGERYLVEKYDLRYVTTGRDLLDLPTIRTITTTPVTVVANPTGAFLTDAETEADFLEGVFLDARILRHDQATETNVRTIERPLILHMATHGFFGKARSERDNPMFRSGLHLADIEQVQVDRDRDDGQLTAYEVSGMDLRGTQLVVLSACETGMGAVDMSEGVFGLRRAFAMAGARTTVMSLWNVSDVTAQRTMQAYYRKLGEGLGRGEAMQAVQLEMLRSKEHAHPKDWAAFIVSGDDDPMEFPVGQEPRLLAEPEPGPPEPEGEGGCATKPTGHGFPVGSMSVGLLGLMALRRRRS